MGSSTNKKKFRNRVLPIAASSVAAALLLAGCGGGGFDDSNESGTNADQSGNADAGALTTSDDPLTILIGSSGDAETTAVNAAVKAWSDQSGVEAKVQVASDLSQELSQGFAGGKPADVFYLATEALPGYAQNGSVQAYGDLLSNKDDFYQPLVENFTYEDQFYCAPKDFSTLALVINNAKWDEAGLTEADYPSTWEDLTAVSEKLASGSQAGLAFGAEFQRVGVFMAQAGGALVEDGQAVADSAENNEALTYVQENLAAGNFAYAADIGAGWGGEAFGTEAAAMVIEGNWITGALENDYPNVEYTVVELPAGPAGKGTLQFTNCWGLAADSPNQTAALELIEFLTSTEQQLEFSDAFGPMPSVKSAADAWKEANPSLVAFVDGAEYAQFIPPIAGVADVISDFNAQIESLKTANTEGILKSVQGNLEAIVK